MMFKRAISVILCTLLGVWSVVAQKSESPLKFDRTEWDFGTILEEADVVTHRFTFRNSGDVPVAIDRAVASCGCTMSDYSRSPVQPAGEGTVTVSFDPKGYSDSFSKSVVVVSGGGKWRNTLIIKGTVTPRTKSVEELYPFEVGGGLRVAATTLSFRQVEQGRTSSMTVAYINTSDDVISTDIVPIEQSGLLTIHAPETICAGCRGDMTFTYDLTAKEGYYGMIHDLVRISVDGQESSQGIYTSMIGVDDFSTLSIEDAPKMTLSAQYHNFGDIRSRKVPYVFGIILRNDGCRTLHIRSVSEQAGLKATIQGGMTVAPGATLPFEMLLYSDKYPSGTLFESIIITTDDPLRPVREIRISAKIK
jgi:hypothetical protein